MLAGMIITELCILDVVSFISASTRYLFEGCVMKQLDAEAAQGANYRLLSLLCDAVLEVKGTGEIIKPTPHVQHLLRAESGKALEGVCFEELLLSGSDRSQFRGVIRAAA